MAKVRNRKTGEVQEIPDSQLGTVLLTGDYDPEKGAKVAVVNEWGQVGTVPVEEFLSGGASQAGMRIATPQEYQEKWKEQQYGQGVSPLIAGLEGVARGVSIGLSDPLLRELGVSAEGLRERKERNPILAGSGEALGILGSVIASGGAGGLAQAGERGALAMVGRAGMGALRASPTGLVATAGRAAESGLARILGEGTLARIGAGALSAAGEGALYGAGQAISEAALGDYELTAEQVLASMKTGAVWSGGAGAAIGSISPLLRGVGGQARRLAGKAEDILPISFAKSMKKTNLEKFISETAFAAAKGVAAGKKFVERAKRSLGDDAIEKIGKHLLDEGVVTPTATLDDIVQRATVKKQQWGQQIGNVMRTLDDEAEITLRPLRKTISDRLQTEVINPLRSSKLPDFQRMADKVERTLDPFLAEGEFARTGINKHISFDELHRIRAQVDDLAYRTDRASPVIEEIRKARSIVENVLSESADKASKRLGESFANTYKGAKEKYAAMALSKDMAEDALARLDTNRNFSLSDMLVTQAAGIGEVMATGDIDPGTLATAFIVGRLHRFVRTRGSAILSGSLYNLTKAQKIEAVRNTAQTIDNITKRSVSKYFSFAKDVPSITKRLVSPTITKAITKEEPIRIKYDKAVKKHDEIMKNMDTVAFNATRSVENIIDAIPQTSTVIASKAMNAAQFLKAKQPAQNISPSEIFAHLEDRQRVSDTEMSKYLRYVEAVENPIDIIKRFGETGDMSREASEALRTVYPKLFFQFEKYITDKLTELKDPLPYQSLLQLSIILNRAMHPTLEPSFISMCQGMHMAIREQNKNAGNRGNLPNRSQEYLSSAQRLG